MKKDDIEFPPLPGVFAWAMVDEELAEAVQEYARAAIEADRQRRHEVTNASEAYDTIDSFLLNNLDDDDYDLYSKALDDVYASQKPTEEVFCEECGDGLVVEDPGICGTCYQTKYVSPQNAEPVVCPTCGTHEVSLEQTCHNSTCSSYGGMITVYEGWESTPHPAEPVKVPSDAQAQSITDRFRNDVAKALGLGSEGNRFADTYLLGMIGDLVDLENEVIVRDEQMVAMRKATSHLLYDHKDVFSSHPKKSDLRKHIKALDAENDRLHALLARYWHSNRPQYKDDDDFHANATLPELDAWQRGWDDCNKGIEAEGWQLVPKELIEFIEAKEHHLPIEDRHALSNMIKAAPKFGEEE